MYDRNAGAGNTTENDDMALPRLRERQLADDATVADTRHLKKHAGLAMIADDTPSSCGSTSPPDQPAALESEALF